MKRNPNTRNIFTAEGRLNRAIDKYNKRMALIRKMNAALERLNDKWDNISIDEINSESEECVIRCDGCSYEFDICNGNIETLERVEKNEDGEEETIIQYVCPKCGNKNEIDHESDNEDEHNSDSEEELINEESSDKSKVVEFVKKVNTDINNSCENINKKNESKKLKFIRDKKILDAINIAMEHKSVTETVSMFNEKDINLVMTKDDNIAAYSTNTGNISFMSDKNNTDDIEVFIVNTRLIVVPHGNLIKFYNNILSQLNIEKVDDKFESIELGGKACIIRLNDNSLAACNFRLTGNDLVMTIIYNIDKDE